MNSLSWIKSIPLPSEFSGCQIFVTQSALNLSTAVGEPIQLIQARRQVLQRVVGLPIAWLQQVHGAEVQVFDDPLVASCSDHWPEKDASATCSHAMALAVLTADCLPVVFYASQGKRSIGIAHAGWKGLAAGVLQACVQQVADLAHAPLTSVRAWMGPAIGPASFEVGLEVKQRFLSVSESYGPAFNAAGISNKVYANLYELATIALNEIGVVVSGGGSDTFVNTDWFSHRGSQQDINRPIGRFATVVRLV